MAIALAEADKYEILEKIGKLVYSKPTFAMFKLHAHTVYLGCGSFGIIRKVKRKSDGFVGVSQL